MAMKRRRQDRAFNRPTRVESLSNHAVGQLMSHLPLRDGHGAPEKRDISRVTRIQHLFALRGPFAVLSAIRSIVIYSVEAVEIAFPAALIDRLWSHVFVERLKGLLPSIADGDPTSAVMLPLACLWIAATLPHVQPQGIFVGATSAVIAGLSVFQCSCARRLSPQAAATACVAVAKQGTFHEHHAPTRTLTPPMNRHLDRGAFLHIQASKCLTGQVDNDAHMRQYTTESRY